MPSTVFQITKNANKLNYLITNEKALIRDPLNKIKNRTATETY